MKNQIINEIQRKMLPYLNNEQLLHLKAVLEASFQGVIIEMGEDCLLYTSPSPRDA